MIGRREFGLAGLSTIALAAIEAKSLAADAKGGHQHMFAECAEACSDCQRECDACATHCATLLSEGKKDHLMTLQTCQDCADICSAAAQIVARNGVFGTIICAACADACAKCAGACEKHASDTMMAACAKECRECEKACRDMVNHPA